MKNEVAIAVTGLEAFPESKSSEIMSTWAFTGIMPNLKLYPASGKIVARNPERMGKFGLNRGGDDHEMLGDQILVIPVAYRQKAVDFRKDPTVVHFNENDPEFIETVEYAEDFKAKNTNSLGCKAMYGSEFLLILLKGDKWTPTIFYLCSPTLRGQGDAVKTFMKKYTYFTHKWIEAGSFQWWGFEPSAANVDPTELPTLPLDKIKIQAEKFLNPPVDEPATDVETVTR